MSNGDVPGSGIPGIGSIISLLSEIFSNAAQVQDLANAVNQVEQVAWTNTIALASWAFGEIGGALDALKGIIGALAGAIAGLAKAIWGHLKAILDAIWNWLKNLHNLIKAQIAAWQKIQKQLDAVRSQYFRKIIDIVQRIRKILVPFRLLHLKFAQVLDARLVGAESELGLAWAKLIQHQNQITAVLDDIVDPRKLLRPGASLGSFGTMVAAIHGAIGAADVRTLLCLSPTAAASPLVAPWVVTQTLVVGEIQTNTGSIATYAAQRDQALRQYATDLGTTSLV